MAEATNLQQVEGAGILQRLAQLFFSGLDKALTDAVEYEEEMGVLKQVNRIPIETLDGKNTYTLTIKLSPIRGKDSFYFVEAETDAPGLDVSKINNKTMRFDNTNIKQFRNTVDKLISSSNFVADMDRTEEPENVGEVVGEPAKGEENASKEGSVLAEGEAKNLMNAAQKWLESGKNVVGSAGGHIAMLKFEFKFKNTDVCQMIINALNEDGKPFEGIDEGKYDITFKNDNGEYKTEDEFLNEIKDNIDAFAEDNGITNIQYATINSSTQVSATFLKDSEGVGITAIQASTNVRASADIIYALLEDPEFAESLPENEEVSFSIVDDGTDYNIEPIDVIDTSRTVIDTYQEISKRYNAINSLKAMIGYDRWNANSFLSAINFAMIDIQNEVAQWVLHEADVLTILQDPFELVPSFERFRDFGNLSEDADIERAVSDEITDLINILNVLSVNLNEVKQEKIEGFIQNVEENLSIAGN